MKVAGLQKNSTIDFPGKLSCVIFAAGCNYDCYYCHNRHLLGAEAKVSSEELFTFLEKRKGLIDGVVITGGEPSLYDDLPEFISSVRDLGYKVKLDTNGSNPDAVKALLRDGLLDFVAVDYKAPLNKYDEIRACKDPKQNAILVENTIKAVMESGIDYEIRTTMIPEIGRGDLVKMAASFPQFKSYAIQKYRPVPDDSRPASTFYSAGDLNELSESIRDFQPNNFVRA